MTAKPSQIAPKRLPEEIELEEKRAELAALETDLANHELELATLKVDLALFERRYLRTVASRYAELDELLARIAEGEASEHPGDAVRREQANTARSKASETAGAATAEESQDQRTQFKPSDDLRALFREAAKAMHPDLASDDEDRARRERFMAEANKAYSEGDEPRLRAILEQWQSSPESVRGEGTAVELVRTIRKLAQAHRRLEEIRSELETLKGSDLCKLHSQAIQAQTEGRDLLNELAEQVQAQIAAARRRLGKSTVPGDHD
jgi:hypothetical protein